MGRLEEVVRTICRERDYETAELVRRASDDSWIIVRVGTDEFPVVIEASCEPPSEERASRLRSAVDREVARLGGRSPVRGDFMTVYFDGDGGCRVWRVCGVSFLVP